MTTPDTLTLDWTEDRPRTNGGSYLLASVDHNMTDEYGRRVGGQATVAEVLTSWAPQLVGKWMLDVRATRDGKRYGALNRETYFDTLDEAKAAAGIKLAAQRKSYARKYARLHEFVRANPNPSHDPSGDKCGSCGRKRRDHGPWDTATTVVPGPGEDGYAMRDEASAAEALGYAPDNFAAEAEDLSAEAAAEAADQDRRYEAASPRHTDTHRTCYRCEKLGRPAYHPVDMFTRRADGTYFSACKPCNREMAQARRQAKRAAQVQA